MAMPVPMGMSMPVRVAVPAAMSPISVMVPRTAGDAFAHDGTRRCMPWRVINRPVPTAAITFAVIVPDGNLERNACVRVRHTDREHHGRKYNELLIVSLSLTRYCFHRCQSGRTLLSQIQSIAIASPTKIAPIFE